MTVVLISGSRRDPEMENSLERSSLQTREEGQWTGQGSRPSIPWELWGRNGAVVIPTWGTNPCPLATGRGLPSGRGGEAQRRLTLLGGGQVSEKGAANSSQLPTPSAAGGWIGLAVMGS